MEGLAAWLSSTAWRMSELPATRGKQWCVCCNDGEDKREVEALTLDPTKSTSYGHQRQPGEYEV